MSEDKAKNSNVFCEKVKDSLIRLKENIKNLTMKSKIILGIVTIIVFILIITLISTIRTSYGNKSGNINNIGFAVKSGGSTIISYINTVDESDNSENYKSSGLFEITSSGKAKVYEKFDKNVYAYSINKIGNWVYYMKVDENNSTRSIVKTNGNKSINLVENLSSYEKNSDYLLNNYQLMYVIDDYVYYINENLNLARVKINGKTKEVIRDEIEVSDFQIYDGYIYINNIDNEFVKINLKDFEDKKTISSINANDFQVERKNIYYIDKSDKLIRTNLEGKEEKTIIDKDIKSFNVVGKDIYYFSEYNGENTNEEGTTDITNEYAIFKLDTKKNETKKIVETATSFSYINVVGKWIYYNDKIDGDYYYYTIYKVKTDGTNKQDLATLIPDSEKNEKSENE